MTGRGASRLLATAGAIGALALAGAGAQEPSDPYAGLRAWAGDIHVHTGLAIYQVLDPAKPHSIGSADEVIDAAASRGLDFLVITDHSNNLDDPRGRAWRAENGATFTLPDGSTTTSEWEYLKSAIRRRNRPGKFVVFLGLEYTRGTTGTATPGHQAAAFPTDDLDRYCSNFTHNAGDCPTARDFFDFVIGNDGVAVMAHPCEKITWGPSDWSEYDPVVTGMEMVAAKCEFDRNGYNDALGRRGLRIGARGSSDSHAFTVGTNDKTICFAPELTRPAILDAMRRNLCYWVDRYPVDLRFSINGVPMGGDVTDTGSGLEIVATARTEWEAELTWMEVIHNGEVIEKHECADPEYDECALSMFVLTAEEGYYYAALSSPTGRRIAISSPIWVRSAP